MSISIFPDKTVLPCYLHINTLCYTIPLQVIAVCNPGAEHRSWMKMEHKLQKLKKNKLVPSFLENPLMIMYNILILVLYLISHVLVLQEHNLPLAPSFQHNHNKQIVDPSTSTHTDPEPVRLFLQ